MSHVSLFSSSYFLQSVGASRWRVWYQRGLTRLVQAVNSKIAAAVALINIILIIDNKYEENIYLRCTTVAQFAGDHHSEFSNNSYNGLENPFTWVISSKPFFPAFS